MRYFVLLVALGPLGCGAPSKSAASPSPNPSSRGPSSVEVTVVMENELPQATRRASLPAPAIAQGAAPPPPLVLPPPRLEPEQERLHLVKRRLCQVRRCYQLGLRRNPQIRGTVRARVVVRADGHRPVVHLAPGVESTVDQCIRGVLQRIRFPAPAQSVVEHFSFRLRFEAGKAQVGVRRSQ